MNRNANAFPQDARAALDDAKLQLALANLKKGFQVKRADALDRLTDPDGLRDAGAACSASRSTAWSAIGVAAPSPLAPRCALLPFASIRGGEENAVAALVRFVGE